MELRYKPDPLRSIDWPGHTAKRDGRCPITAGRDAGLLETSSGGWMGAGNEAPVKNKLRSLLFVFCTDNWL